MSEDLKKFPEAEEMDERFARRMNRVVERFIEDLSELSVDYEIENMSGLYMIAYSQVLEVTSPETEAIEEFAEEFLTFVQEGIEDGEIESRMTEEEKQDRIKKVKEELKKKEGRSR